MRQQSPNVLLVEDSPTQAELIAAQLSQYGIQVIVASDGAQGLRMVAAQLPDLIVLDVNMPKMDGYQMCQRIRRDLETADIPIIMFTAANSESEIQRGVEAGADGYVVKDQDAILNLLATLNDFDLLPH